MTNQLKKDFEFYLDHEDEMVRELDGKLWRPRISSESDRLTEDGVRASLTWRGEEVHRHGSQPYGSNS
jgi:hypothetical protein